MRRKTTIHSGIEATRSAASADGTCFSATVTRPLPPRGEQQSDDRGRSSLARGRSLIAPPPRRSAARSAARRRRARTARPRRAAAGCLGPSRGWRGTSSPRRRRRRRAPTTPAREEDGWCGAVPVYAANARRASLERSAHSRRRSRRPSYGGGAAQSRTGSTTSAVRLERIGDGAAGAAARARRRSRRRARRRGRSPASGRADRRGGQAGRARPRPTLARGGCTTVFMAGRAGGVGDGGSTLVTHHCGTLNFK